MDDISNKLTGALVGITILIVKMGERCAKWRGVLEVTDRVAWSQKKVDKKREEKRKIICKHSMWRVSYMLIVLIPNVCLTDHQFKSKINLLSGNDITINVGSKS